MEEAPSGTFRTVTSSLTYAVPHLAGAIDILMVQQPNGTLKSSPFYVRFGKYTSLRSQDKRVTIAINDTVMDFTMQLGRTGEAYFVNEVEEEVPVGFVGEADEGAVEANLSLSAEPSSVSDALAHASSSSSGSSDDENDKQQVMALVSGGVQHHHTASCCMKHSQSAPALASLAPKSTNINNISNNPTPYISHHHLHAQHGQHIHYDRQQSQSQTQEGDQHASSAASPSTTTHPKHEVNIGAATDTLEDQQEQNLLSSNDVKTAEIAATVAHHGIDPLAAAATANVGSFAETNQPQEQDAREGDASSKGKETEETTSIQAPAVPLLKLDQEQSPVLTPRHSPTALIDQTPASESLETSESEPETIAAAAAAAAAAAEDEDELTNESKQDPDTEHKIHIRSTDTSTQTSPIKLNLPSVSTKAASASGTATATSSARSSPRATSSKMSALTSALAGLSPAQGITSDGDGFGSLLLEDEQDIGSQSQRPRMKSGEAGINSNSHGNNSHPVSSRGRWGSNVELSLCWDQLREEMTPEEVARVFESEKVDADSFVSSPISLLEDPRLACRLGSSVIHGKEAMPLVLAALAFGPEVAASMRVDSAEEYSIAMPTSARGSSPTTITTTTSSAAEHIKTTPIPSPSASSSPPDSPTSSTNQHHHHKHRPSYTRSSSWRDWLSFSWKSSSGTSPPSLSPQNSTSSELGKLKVATTTKNDTKEEASPRETPREDAGGVPPEAEAALLAGALGQASQVQVEEIKGIRRSATGRPPILVKRRRAFVPTPEQLIALVPLLKVGQNTVTFSFGKQQLRAYIYLVAWNSRIIISDIDGTITKSDVLGHLGQLSGLFDWSHSGVAPLLSRIQANGYCLLFLSSRSIAQASITRDYLHSLTQDGHSMPPGPVLLAPDGLFPALFREVVLRRPQEFKIRCLEDIKSLFPGHWNPFFAGFGNRDTDEMSYMAVGVPASRVFIINPKGELRKACSAVRTSTWSTLSGLIQLTDAVFPPVAHALRTTSPVAIAAGLSSSVSSLHDSQSTADGIDAPLRKDDNDEEAGQGEEESRNMLHRHDNHQEKKKDSKAVPELSAAAVNALIDEGTPLMEHYNDVHFWRMMPSIVIEDDEAFGDPEGGVGSDEESSSEIKKERESEDRKKHCCN